MSPACPDVVVVGSANIDLVATVAALPRAGETVSALAFQSFLGGKGYNQAVAAARLGAAVAFVGCVGADDEGGRIRGQLSREGIAIDHVATAAQAPTGHALVTVDAGAENSIVVVPGANGCLAPQHITEAGAMIANAPVLVAQLEVPLETVVAAAALASGTVVLNPAPAQQLPDALLADIDVLVVNEVEYEAITARALPQQAEALAAELAADQRLPAAVVVTAGARGAFAWDGTHLVEVPAPRVDVVDTTGAGDTFIGALADALRRGQGLVAAATWAVHAGALSVRALGATSGMPDADAVAASVAAALTPARPHF